MGIFIDFWWVYNWLWVFRNTIQWCVTRTVRILIYWTSQNYECYKQSYECYRVWDWLHAETLHNHGEGWGSEALMETLTSPQGGWTRWSRSETLVDIQMGIRTCWEISGRPLSWGSTARIWAANLGPLSIHSARRQEKGLMPREEWGQPGTHQAAQLLRTKTSKEGAKLLPNPTLNSSLGQFYLQVCR